MSTISVIEDASGRIGILGANSYQLSQPFVRNASITVVLTARDGFLSYVAPTPGVSVSGSGTHTLTITGLWGDVGQALDALGPLYTPLANASGSHADVVTQIVTGAAAQFPPPFGAGIVNDTYDVDITPQPDAPDSLVLSGGAIAENAVIGAVVGRLTGTDPDPGDTLRYALSDPTGHFSINPLNGTITVAAPLDFETTRFYDLFGSVRDQTGLSRSLIFRVDVTNVNEATILINSQPGFPGATLYEIAPAGTFVSDANAIDSNTPTNAFIYSIPALSNDQGTIVANNGRFAIDPFTGLVTIADPARINFEVSAAYSVVVRATTITSQDSGTTATGDYAETTVMVHLLDANRTPAGIDTHYAIEAAGQNSIVITTPQFNLGDTGDTLDAVIISSLPTRGLLVVAAQGQSVVFDGAIIANARAVVAGEAISAGDLAAGALSYHIAHGQPAQDGYASFGFQVRDSGGTAHGAVDTDPTPNLAIIDSRNQTIGGATDAAGAGDFNGDGIDDFIVRAPNQPGSPAYVIFGRDGGLGTIDLAHLAPADGIRITAPGAIASVSGAGDVNGDGIADVVIGVPGALDGDSAGAAYIVFGRAGISGTVDLATLAPAAGITIIGNDPSNIIGVSVARGGDINGDGLGDVLIGASPTFGNFEGSLGTPISTYAIFGRGAGGVIDLAQPTGVSAISIGALGNLTLAGVGDVNGDGFDDVMIADPAARFGAGVEYVAYGRADGALNAFVLTGGFSPSMGFGTAIAGAGDFNGDGIADFTIAGPGSSFLQLVFGRPSGFTFFQSGTAQAEPLNFPAPPRLIIEGVNSASFGTSIASADINDDGYADLIVGAPGYGGTIYTIYGRPGAGGGRSDIRNLPGVGVVNGFAGALAGSHVAAIGDINHDGFADFIVQAGTGAGAYSSIIFGHARTTSANRQPDLAIPLADQTALLNRAFAYTIPTGSFTDPDAGDVLSYSVTGLPAWLSFDAATQRFSGTPTGADLGSITVRLIVTDGVTAALRETLHFTAADPLGFTTGNDVRVNPPGNDVTIDGLAGVDTLDMSAFTTPITLNTDTATIQTIDGVERVINVEGFILGSGDDIARLGGGAFTVAGGPGDDIYYDDAGNDTLIEQPGGGTDSVYVGVGYTLPANIENLIYTGTGAATLIGNDGNNVLDTGTTATGFVTLIGGEGDDVLVVRAGSFGVGIVGGAGNDTLAIERDLAIIPDDIENIIYIGTGNATLTGNRFSNFITGGAGDDTIDAGDGDDFVRAGAGNDIINGGLGRDLIDGGAGNDIISGGAGAANELAGGLGDDIFIVAAIGDTILEYAGGGTDEVRTALAVHVLRDNVENLTFTGGAANFVGIGNAGDNVITGGSGFNVLGGGAGNDTLIGLRGTNELIGGTGNDVYIVDNRIDTIVEYAGEGIDEVRTAQDVYVLRDYVENLVYTGTGTFAGIGTDGTDNSITGGAGADFLSGMGGNDVLIGGSGADILLGGAGADQFRYNGGETGYDRILDFTPGTDTIALANSGFAHTATTAFIATGAPVATSADSTFLYDVNSGILSYDADGNGGGAAVQLAQLNTGLTLSLGDFVFV